MFFFIIIVYSQNESCYLEYKKMGINRYNQGKYNIAIKNFSAAIECDDLPEINNIQEWINKSKKCNIYKNISDKKIISGNICEAIKYLKKIINLNPNDRYCKSLIISSKSIITVNNEMIFVKGGTFTMGNDELQNLTPHNIKLSDYYIDKYEVTNEEFAKFLNFHGNKVKNGNLCIDINDEDCKIYKKDECYYAHEKFKNKPVVEVSWHGANAYAKWLGKRLPTEAEWEYAAKGGIYNNEYDNNEYETISNYAWYRANSNQDIHNIGQKKPNELGIYDMRGNVFEWCLDWYSANFYVLSPYENPMGVNAGEYKVIRGGSALSFKVSTKVSSRFFNLPSNTKGDCGFRCVMPVDNKQNSASK